MVDLLRKVAARRLPGAPSFAAFLDAVKRWDRDAAWADGYRPMHYALHKGRKLREQALHAARFLLKHGAEYTICLATALGDAESVRAMLQRDRNQANHPDTK